MKNSPFEGRPFESFSSKPEGCESIDLTSSSSSAARCHQEAPPPTTNQKTVLPK